jgi:S1-C subfamily serine protease
MRNLFAIAVAAVSAAALTPAAPAAPALGVEWRAPANPKTPGVKVVSVDAGGNAEELGLGAGDVVVADNGAVVKTGAEATKAVRAANEKLTLLVHDSRTGGLVEIAADIDEPVKGFRARGKARYKNVTRSVQR